jgi:beta-lactamase regulating signal transducer with metallopeptidase domain
MDKHRTQVCTEIHRKLRIKADCSQWKKTVSLIIDTEYPNRLYVTIPTADTVSNPTASSKLNNTTATDKKIINFTNSHIMEMVTGVLLATGLLYKIGVNYMYGEQRKIQKLAAEHQRIKDNQKRELEEKQKRESEEKQIRIKEQERINDARYIGSGGGGLLDNCSTM